MACSKELRRAVAMFRLDYLSCFFTVVATILIGRKMWTGLVVSGLNSLVVCVIGLHTSQYGFIPANLFCICINAFHLRAWLKVQKDPSASPIAVKGLWRFARTPLRTNTDVGVPHP
jgi:hypothetical protein